MQNPLHEVYSPIARDSIQKNIKRDMEWGGAYVADEIKLKQEVEKIGEVVSKICEKEVNK